MLLTSAKVIIKFEYTMTYHLVKKISQAVKLIKGVSSVSVSKPKTNILQSESYKAGIEDIKKGNVTTYSSSDDMFNDLMT